ncbi:hypothetical protein GCM10017771_36080 [Streptomyces capitiformicae]|uniref:Tetratricopeptide repeat protein n=1 Tax=Streptomyces capitiformicae TaxID=2014920 RepID=A0A919GQC6_9ACTN|nr:hypothetical protein GCM10017771_36080 [Streptomyces capitiformicae]
MPGAVGVGVVDEFQGQFGGGSAHVGGGLGDGGQVEPLGHQLVVEAEDGDALGHLDLHGAQGGDDGGGQFVLLGEDRCGWFTQAQQVADHPGGAATAASYWAQADRIAAGQDDPEVRSKARAGTGLSALADGDLDAAEDRFHAALDYALQDHGSPWTASLTHVWLGTVHLLRGAPATAVPEIERGLRLARTRGDRLSTYVALYNLSQAALALGDHPLARRHVEEGIILSQETRDLANLAYFVETLAVIESQEGDHIRVATLLGATTGLRETVGADVYAYYHPDQSLRAAAEESARAVLGDDAHDEAVDAGRTLDARAVAELALRNTGGRHRQPARLGDSRRVTS